MKRTALLSATAAATAAAIVLAVAVAPVAAQDSYDPSLSAGSRRPADTAAYTSTVKVVATTAFKRTAAPAAPKKATTAPRATGDLARAKSTLAALVAKHPILKGTTVEMGNAHGYQAIAYYRSGRIIISRSHRASIERILNHEVWHVIDWRDNGRIDWGENVPR